MDFVGRSAELALLEREIAAPRGAFVPIYGRRRVGKSELILRFLAGRRALYHLGKEASGALQLREVLEQAASTLDEPLLARLPQDDWRGALGEVARRGIARGRFVLVLDEFQWLAAAAPELPSVLQELWDRSWKDEPRFMLILCGSMLGFMEREVLGRRSPLFGRRTAQIRLDPLSFRECAGLHPRWSVSDRARAWFICGGIPHYHRYFDPGRSVESSIEHAILDEHAPLRREPDFLLREELRDLEGYFAVLMAIAEGSHTTAEIAARSGLPARSLPYHLTQLCELGYVARRHPLTGLPPVARHVRFVLEDPLLRFWFRFVFPNQSLLQFRGAATTFKDRIRPTLDAYFGSCFERLCRQSLPALYEREGISAAFEIGSYWDKSVQIDLVSVRDDHRVDLGECKWGAVASTGALVKELEAKATLYPNPRNATLDLRVFARGRIKDAVTHPRVRFHPLEALG